MFRDVVDLYKSDHETLERILQEDCCKMNNSIWQKFLLWLGEVAPSEEKEIVALLSHSVAVDDAVIRDMGCHRYDQLAGRPRQRRRCSRRCTLCGILPAMHGIWWSVPRNGWKEA